MTNELIALQEENVELRTKLQMASLQIQKTSRLEDSLFSPALYEHYSKIAQRFSRSTLIPKNYIGKPDDIFIAMAMGYQLGFSVEQSLQDIAVINGRPCLWGDGLLALIYAHNQLEYLTEHQLLDNKGNVIGAACTIKRKGHPEHIENFTIEDAKKANLWGKQGPWSQYPNRMLKMRARSFAVRDKFSDALRGVKVAEEVMDYIDAEPVQKSATRASNKLMELLQNKESSHANATLQTTSITVPVLVEPPYSEDSPQAISDIQPEEMGKTRTKKDNTPDPKDALPITDELLDEVSGLLQEKPLDKDRMDSAMRYFEVTAIEDMTIGQAKRFIEIINKTVR